MYPTLRSYRPKTTMADLHLESDHQPTTTSHLRVTNPSLLAFEDEDTEGYNTINQTRSSDKNVREKDTDEYQPKQRRKRIGGSKQPNAPGKATGGSRASAKARSSAPTRSNLRRQSAQS